MRRVPGSFTLRIPDEPDSRSGVPLREKLRLAKEMEEVSWDQVARLARDAHRPEDPRDVELLGLIERSAALDRDGPTGVVAGDPIIIGNLGRAMVDDVVDRHEAALHACSERVGRGGYADVVMKFVVGKTGAVTSAAVSKSTIDNPEIEQCLADRFARMRFPAPKGGGIVVVKYPLAFRAG